MSVKYSDSTEVHGFEAYQNMRSLLGPDDMVLLLACVSPIHGKTRLQKEVFLLWKRYHKISVDPGFFPYKFGPYSQVVNDFITILKKRGLIEERTGKKYHITTSGKIYILQKIKELNISLSNITEWKIRWDEWMTHGIARYIYRIYPEYAIQSEAADLKW